MKTPFIISLNGNQEQLNGMGNKARLLSRAKAAALPVPEGLILTHNAWQLSVAAGWVVVQGDTLHITDAEGLLEALHLAPDFNPVAVRSAFSVEDEHHHSLAGQFTSKLNVNATNVEQMAQALGAVWASAGRAACAGCDTGNSIRRDVLIMQMVDARYAGVAFTEREFEDDVVNYTTGLGDKLVAGSVAGQTLYIPKLRSWEESTSAAVMDARTASAASLDPDLDACMRRVQRLLRDIRRVFPGNDWDIEWADDGQRCWLLQVRPVTRSTRRNEAFTIANHREILPELPSRFISSTMASCAADLFAFYRRFDRRLPANRPLVEMFQGRPYINLSLMSEMMRMWGLSTRMVTDSIGGEVVQDVERNPSRLWRNGSVLLRIFRAQAVGVLTAHRTMHAMRRKTAQPCETFSECVDTLRWLHTSVTIGMLLLMLTIVPKLHRLRRAGTLAEHSARHSTISSDLYSALEPLRAQVQQRPDWRTQLQRGVLPDDASFRTMWHAYLEKHGHRGIYESDIARPRFAEDPAPLLASLLHPPRARRPLPARTRRGWLTWPIWWHARLALRTREWLRYTAMVAMMRLRTSLLALADHAVAQGLLPTSAALWDLDIDEVRRLDEGWQPDAAFWQQRRAEIAAHRQQNSPDLIYRFGRSAADKLPDVDSALEGRLPLHGMGLTKGDVCGRAWVLSEPHSELPAGFRPEETILVARAIDAGWVSTFAAVAGVVVEMGGDLSHGSIILREIGLPAITNVRGATHYIRTGDRLRLCAEEGAVYRLTDASVHSRAR